MNKRLLWGLSALVAAGGCATNNGTGGSLASNRSVEPVFESANVAPPRVGEVVGSINRSPAQMNSTRWVADSRAIQVSPNGGQANITLTPRLIETYPETYRYTCDKLTWGTTLCEDYVCSGGTGKSPLWNNYYNGPGDKVSALDAALLGIGPSSARALHQSGLFRSKPKSWQEFRTRMNQALRQGVITDQQYREVFSKYGEQNRINLGYAGETCRVQQYTCDVYGLFSVPDGCEGTRPAERVAAVLNRPIQVNISSPQLQSFETESVTVSAAQDFDSIQVLRGDKTDYRVSKVPNGDGAILNLEGVGRFQINLPAAVLAGIRFNDGGRGNSMNAVVSVDPKYMGQDNDKLILTLQVTHCEPPTGWFSFVKGDCKGEDSEAKIKEAPAYHPITQATSSFALPTVPAGHRVWVQYSLHRENSRWYNNSPVNVNEIKLPELKK